ncbi:MAG: hypothetical protein PHW04_03425 [Candidatus Wallbacteria bacterium]|nr:hypothetical protein [Candidatus Wallbacteria bacterium]
MNLNFKIIALAGLVFFSKSCFAITMDPVIPGVSYTGIVNVVFSRPSYANWTQPGDELPIPESVPAPSVTRDQAILDAIAVKDTVIQDAIRKATYTINAFGDPGKYRLEFTYQPVYPQIWKGPVRLMPGLTVLAVVNVYVWQNIPVQPGVQEPPRIKYFYEVCLGSYGSTSQAMDACSQGTQRAVQAALAATSLKTGVPVDQLKSETSPRDFIIPSASAFTQAYWKFPHVIKLW